MAKPQVNEGTRIVVLAGAGLAKSAGAPDLHDDAGAFEGRPGAELATESAWRSDPGCVRRYYDDQRLGVVPILPSEAHDALARMQHALGTRRCTLVTESVDGLLQKAGAHDVIELEGSLWRVRCTEDASHPAVGIFGRQSDALRCRLCGASMRPDVAWPSEPAHDLAVVQRAVQDCHIFVLVGITASEEPAASLLALAKESRAWSVGLGDVGPAHPLLDDVHPGALPDCVPALVALWLGEA